MRTVVLWACAAASCLLISCGGESQGRKPLQTGIVESGLVWEHPRGAVGGNTGKPIKKGSKVEIFDQVIIIHLEDGTKQVEGIAQVSNLIIR